MTLTIIFDNNCKFCTKFAQWCIKKQNKFTALSVRDAEAKKLLRSVGVKFIDLQTIYLVEDKVFYTRSKAVFKVLNFMNFPWKLLAIFQFLPVKFTDYFYKLFAKYRYYF